MTGLSVAIVSVPVADQQRSLDFYTRSLGLEVVADARFERVPGDISRWVQLRGDGGTTITLVTWFPTMQPGSLKGIVLEAPDLDEAVATLSNRGVVFEHDPVDAPWGRFTSFHDPDGNGWVLQQRRPNDDVTP